MAAVTIIPLELAALSKALLKEGGVLPSPAAAADGAVERAADGAVTRAAVEGDRAVESESTERLLDEALAVRGQAQTGSFERKVRRLLDALDAEDQ